MNNKLRIGLVLSALVVVLWTVVTAPCAYGGTKRVALTAKDAVTSDLVGYSVAAGSETRVIGVPFGDATDTLLNTGAVHVFRYDQATGVWDEGIKVTATDAGLLAGFGWSVATTSDLVAVGAPTTGSATGTLRPTGIVYLFSSRFDETAQAGACVQLTRLAALDGAGDDRFGWSVAMGDNLLVVGAPKRDGDAQTKDTGAAYVFRGSYDQTTQSWSWKQEAKLTANDAAACAMFGTSVAVSGETVVVGAAGANAAYVFRFDGNEWVHVQELVGPSSSRFGFSVAISNETIVVGAPGVDAAYTFRFDGTTWLEEGSPLRVEGAVPGDQFGHSVAVDSDLLVVGAPYGQDAAGNQSGYAYVWRYDQTGKQWKPAPKPKLTFSDDATGPDEFGFALALKGNRILVGAPKVGNVGAAAEFVINRPPVASATVNSPEVHEGDTVTVSGSASDPDDGDNLTYTWVQTAGPVVSFDPTAAQFEFAAPEAPPEGATLTFQLTVNDGEENSAPVEVSVVVTKPPQSPCQVTSRLGERLPWIPDRDTFVFQGNTGEKVTLTLQPAQEGTAEGGRAVLILQDRIRGAWFFRADRGGLPNQIQATLPATGEYLVTVMDDPFSRRGTRFRGDYVLSLEGASGCLEPTQHCLTVKKKVDPPTNSCSEKESLADGFWF